MKIGIIPTDLSQPIRIEEIEGKLLDYQLLVKDESQEYGTIEAVRMQYTPMKMDLYVNDEFLIYGMERNERAMVMYASVVAPEYASEVYLAGPAVAVGGVGGEGETLGLTERNITRLRLLDKLFGHEMPTS